MSVSAIDAVLRGYSGLTNLISSRIYRERIPQNESYPLVLYNIKEEPINTLGGASSLKHYMYNFGLYGADYSVLESIKNELINALNSSVDFKAVLKSIDDQSYQDELGNYALSIEFSIWY